jgi:ABC-type sugar transport system ATPase subunit
MLKIENICVKAGNFYLKDVALFVSENTCHVVMGPSGHGKTLLLETVVGLKDSLSGEIHIFNREITKAPPEKRGLSYLPQDLALFPHLNVGENINYSLKMRGVDKNEGNRVDEIIAAVGIEHLVGRSTRYLSGGEKQRVALARALAGGCRVLVLDEPFSSLNGSLKRELWDLMKKLKVMYRLTILMVTHDEQEAGYLGDARSFMVNGQLTPGS